MSLIFTLKKVLLFWFFILFVGQELEFFLKFKFLDSKYELTLVPPSFPTKLDLSHYS